MVSAVLRTGLGLTAVEGQKGRLQGIGGLVLHRPKRQANVGRHATGEMEGILDRHRIGFAFQGIDEWLKLTRNRARNRGIASRQSLVHVDHASRFNV